MSLPENSGCIQLQQTSDRGVEFLRSTGQNAIENEQSILNQTQLFAVRYPPPEMKCSGYKVTLVATVSFLIALAPMLAQEVSSGSRLTPELLQSRILGVQDTEEIDEATRARLIGLYRQSIANLEVVRANREATEEYRLAVTQAPIEMDAILASIEQRRETDPTADLQITTRTTSDELDRRLQEEFADLAAVEARLTDLDDRQENESQRLTQARERIAAARLLVADMATQSGRLATAEIPLLTEASRWSSETRLEELRSEIEMLDQELLSQPARVRLLRARRDDVALSVIRIAQRVGVLRSVVNDRRRSDAELSMAQATTVLEGSSGQLPVVRELAEANISLVENLKLQVGELESLSQWENRTKSHPARLAEAFRSTRRKLQLEGSSAPLGLTIRQQRSLLPSTDDYAQERRELHRNTTIVSLRLIESEDERRELNDLNDYVENRIARAAAAPLEADVRADLDELAESRRILLDRTIAYDAAEQQRLYALDDVLRQLLEQTAAYDEFLAARLLWVRSTRPIDSVAFAALPDEIAAYFSPGSWLETVRLTSARLWRSPGFLLILLGAFLLFLRRKWLRTALVNSGNRVGRVQLDSMKYTIAALALTLPLALPAPLILGTLGWAIATADAATTFSIAIASGLLASASGLLFLLSLRVLCEPGGVADRHFGWNREKLTDLRRLLAWYLAVAFPFHFLTMSAAELHSATNGGTLGLLGFCGLLTAAGGLAVGLGHPDRGLVGHPPKHREEDPRLRGRYPGITLALALAIPLTLSALALVGFRHTAAELTERVYESVLLLTAVWVGRGFVQRWLLMTRLRLARHAAIKAQQAESSQRSGDHPGAGRQDLGIDNIGAPDADLVALDADSRTLLNAAVFLLAILGLGGIWGQMLPALGLLNDVTLWNATAITDGVESLAPVTLADLLLALLIGMGGYFTARNLPSLLDIILLNWGKVNAGGRYAFSTLSRYAVVAATTLLVLGLLGAGWSQIGWAVAGLSVGIGFGLQEIVANFICGLILLFERPVRVGDMVTIGDAQGTVTRIRIRATTIRDREWKELVMPNKELITGPVLNWSLSDAVTRVVIKVGVAYGSDVDRAMELLDEAAREGNLGKTRLGLIFRFLEHSQVFPEL